MGNEYCFGVSRKRVTRAQARKCASIAKRTDACFIEADLPGTGYQRWFSARNYGSPFNERLAADVRRYLIAAGIVDGEI